MSITADITFGVTGQHLSYAAPEGRPASVESVTVYWHRDGDEHPDEGALDGEPAVDGVATSLTSEAGPDTAYPRRLYLGSVEDIEAGREYLVTSTGGAREVVEVTAVDSSGVEVRYPLAHRHPSGSTFESTLITVPLADAWLEDKSNLPLDGLSPQPSYRVRWVYTVDGRSYAKDSYFRLVRYAGRHEVTPLDVSKRSAAFALDQQRYEFDGTRIIDAAYERVKADLYTNGLSDAAMRDRQVMRELVIRQAIFQHQVDKLYQGGGNADAIAAAEADYNQHLNQVIQGNTRPPFDTSSNGAGTRVPRQGLWRTAGGR